MKAQITPTIVAISNGMNNRLFPRPFLLNIFFKIKNVAPNPTKNGKMMYVKIPIIIILPKSPSIIIKKLLNAIAKFYIICQLFNEIPHLPYISDHYHVWYRFARSIQLLRLLSSNYNE